jgi:hypothetical protein
MRPPRKGLQRVDVMKATVIQVVGRSMNAGTGDSLRNNAKGWADFRPLSSLRQDMIVVGDYRRGA